MRSYTLAGLLALAACGDNNSNNPGADAGAGAGCRSNPDCAWPTPVCDTVAGRCVECLALGDCADKPGTVCSLGACACPNPDDPTVPLAWCPPLDGAPARCVDGRTSQNDCGACGHACFGDCMGGKCVDPWEPTATAGAPSARSHHVAVWTGSEMLVWGGTTASGDTNTGGLYNPVKRTWRSTTLVNAPLPRQDATAVWDDVENVAIIWGGSSNGSVTLTGGRLNPRTNTWRSTASMGAPPGRTGHGAVWATAFQPDFMGAMHGMIVWGGSDRGGPFGDGAVYDPVRDAWIGIAPNGPSPRGSHAAVWNPVDRKMIVFGGIGFDGVSNSAFLNDGAIWDPSAVGTPTEWLPLPPGTPIGPRAYQSAVWDAATPGMVVFGGYDGASYLPDGARLSGGIWTALANAGGPEARDHHSAVWLPGTKQTIVFGGENSAGLLDTVWALDAHLAWMALPTAPAARRYHTAVANGSTMIIWGGDLDAGPTASGAVLNLAP